MSALIEHKILVVGFVSGFWKHFFNYWSITSLLSATLISVGSCYFSFVAEQKWTTWNCETPNFWFHQLKNVNRQPQALGLWCVFLSPFLAYLLPLSVGNQFDYFALIILAMINCPLLSRFIIFSFLRKWKLSALLADVLASLLNFYLLRFALDVPAVWTCVFSMVPVVWNSCLTPKLMTLAAKSFTLGEFQLLYSSVALALVSSIRLITRSQAISGDFDAILILVAWTLVSCASFIVLCFTCAILRNSALLFWFVLFTMAVSAYLLCLFINGLDMLSWIADFFLFRTPRDAVYRRWIVILFWSLCVACTIRFAVACWTMPRLGTVHRKFFHLTIGLVTMTGLLYDPALTVLASALMFQGFVVLELMRLCDVEPIGKPLKEMYAKFLDYQDQGPLVLTPVYLLIGCFVPIWVDLPTSDIELRHFAGLVAVGVGDAVAAIGGTYIGRTPWRMISSGRKTVEGTVCGFISQVVVAFFVLHCTGSVESTFVAWMIWSCLLISLLETFSAQVDNLVLPLFALWLFII